MAKGLTNLGRLGRLGLAAALTSAALLGGAVTSGCAVSETDIHRWETTQHGPDKLVAVLTHDKYSWQLRGEAALSLLRMKPRSGKHLGLEMLTKALGSLSEEARKRIVNEITPTIVEQMKQPPPVKGENNVLPPDPSISYKDAAFALLSNEPTLVSDEKSKSDLVATLMAWVQTDFEHRVENTSMRYGIEQIMRHPLFREPSVKGLPQLINEDSTKLDRLSGLIADIGDAETKKRGSEALVALAKRIDSPEWIAKQKPLVDDANKRAGRKDITAEQLDQQLKKFQEQELEKVLGNMKKVGGRPVVDYCINFARDKTKSEEMRVAALAAIENAVDKDQQGDIDRLFEILKEEGNPDKVRGMALLRMGELPKEKFVPKLYMMFDAKKWQVRLEAARMVIKTMTTKDVPEFMKRLPQDDSKKMALSEAIAYGVLILNIDSAGGPKPRDALNPYMRQKAMGPKLAAFGSYYGAKKADGAVLAEFEGDTTPVPKCEAADNCGWSCDVPKAPGSKEKETKTITTVGEFVKFCIEPSLE